MFKWNRVTLLLAILFGVFVFNDVVAWAQGASTDYRIDESFIGPGSNLESNSAGYTIEAGQQSVGNTGGTTSSSTDYNVLGGHTTTSDPSLTCALNTSTINFGAFSSATTLTANATFSVLNYTTYGYNVTIIGNPPSQGAHNLTGLNPAATSQVGTEQFGINLVANTSPTSFGAFPAQVPDSTFSFGDATANYSTPNTYRYVSGEVIASAPKSSGRTDYTISYIVNVSNNTPGGAYSGNQVILCTGTY